MQGTRNGAGQSRINMKIFVTGGAGFIGANFLNLLVPRHREHHFINVDKLTYAANLHSLGPISEDSNYSLERTDIADARGVEEIFERHQPDAVIHFAAESHVDRSILEPAEFVRTNIQGTFELLEACRRHWKDRQGLFHHVSTDEVYGSLGDEGLFTEDSRYDPSSPYSASKASSDHLVRAYARTYGLRTRITNCSNNYGPLQFPEKLIPLMVLNCLEEKPLPVYGAGQNVRDWLYVTDHCEAIWRVVQDGKDGETYNIGGNNEVRNIDVVHQICHLVAKHTGRPESDVTGLITFVKDRPGHDLRYAIDATRMRTDLGWEPTETFESGLEKTVRWYIDNSAWVEQVRSGSYRDWLEQNYVQRDDG
jgi:dTDP-glucose 4,6-dehydratase